MSTPMKIGAILLAILVCVGLGYGIASWRHQKWIADYTKREQKRLDEIQANNAEKDKLRGENNEIRKQNDTLREDIATLSASEEVLKQFVKEHGGNIAAEGQKLEQINEQLKEEQDRLGVPADRCTRCRRFSATALAAKLIDKPLTCADECAGTNR